MAVIPNTTTQSDIQLRAREIDFISRFNDIWEALREIMGIMRPIRKQPGTKLVSSKADIVLQSGNVAEGDEVPLSKATVVPVSYEDLTLEKYRKAVTAEAVNKFGAAIAVQKTDDALLRELQNSVLDRFYTFLQTGTLTSTEADFQMAVSMAIGLVTDKFKKLRKDSTGIVTFVNTLDVYRYLGSAAITMQNRQGMQYMRDFMGADTVILSSEIPQGKVLATPSENMDLYYIDPSDADFQQLGLNYTVVGETPLIGVHMEGNYGRVMGETHALMGMKLWAEYLDGIANVTFGETLGSLTVTSAAGTTSGTTKLTVTPAKGSGNLYKYKVSDTAAAVTYGQNVQTWTAWDGTADITAESGKIVTVVECGSDYKAKSAGSATVTAKA